MSTKVKMEPEEEVQPSTSGGDVQPEQQPETVEKIVREASDSEDTLDSDDIDDEFLTQYCETVDSVQPMTVSKELFYTEPGAEAEKVVISAIVPAKESTLLPYCVKEVKEEDCETIGTDSEVEEINKEEVRNVLKELAGLK